MSDEVELSNKCSFLIEELRVVDMQEAVTQDDEVYFQIWLNDVHYGTCPPDKTQDVFAMKAYNERAYRKVGFVIPNLTYGDKVRLELREQDKGTDAGQDEVMGTFAVYTDKISKDDNSMHENRCSGDGGTYDVGWRVLNVNAGIRMCTLVVERLKCIHVTGGKGNDDIYFKILVDDMYWNTHPKKAMYDGNIFSMGSGDVREIGFDLQLVYGVNVYMEVRDQDNVYDPGKDEVVGSIKITTEDVDPGDTSSKTNHLEGADGVYEVTWRLLSQKIPSIRILGIYCQLSSSNCNNELADEITGIVSECLSASSKAIGYVKTPNGQLISKAFKACSNIVKGINLLAQWIANAVEGADDVYLQTTLEGFQSPDGGGFCPESGGVMYMNDEDQKIFLDEFGKYFRFPLDHESVTIELREKDKNKHDVSLGAFTVTMEDYEKYKDHGAICRPLDTFYDNQNGQGAIYHVCYSFASEDWSKLPNTSD